MSDTRTQSTNREEAEGQDNLYDKNTNKRQVQRRKYSCIYACMPVFAVAEEGDKAIRLALRGKMQVSKQSWAMDLH